MSLESNEAGLLCLEVGTAEACEIGLSDRDEQGVYRNWCYTESKHVAWTK